MLDIITALCYTMSIISLLLAASRKRGKHADWQPRISVIVPAYNAEKTISDCIESVLDSNYNDREVIVVNDCSTDHTKEECEKYGDKIHLINLSKNSGKAIALNEGFKESNGDIIFILDSDTFVEDNCFSEVIKHFYDGVGAVTTKRVVFNQDSILTELQQVEYIFFSIFTKVQDFFHKVISINGSGTAILREAWQELGGFKNTVTEDTDFGFRLVESGWNVKYADYAIIRTVAPDKSNTWFSQKIRWGKGFLECVLNYPNVLLKDFYLLLFVVPFYLFGIITFLVGLSSFFMFIYKILYLTEFNPVASSISTIYLNPLILISFLTCMLIGGMYKVFPLLLFIAIIWVPYFHIVFLVDKERQLPAYSLVYLIGYMPILTASRCIGYYGAIKDFIKSYREPL